MSVWGSWYKRKGYAVEPEIPYISKLLKKRSRILDIGCGHGRHVIYFASRGHEVYGIDKDGSVIKNLQKKLGKHGLSANLKISDITKKLPYKRNFFNLIIATRSIHHTNTKNVKNIFKEINRTLNKGGVLFLQVPSYESAEEYVKSREMYGKEVGLKWEEPRTYIPLSGPEKGIPHHSFDRKEMMHLLKTYKILKIHLTKAHYHGYCIVAQKSRKD